MIHRAAIASRPRRRCYAGSHPRCRLRPARGESQVPTLSPRNPVLARLAEARDPATVSNGRRILREGQSPVLERPLPPCGRDGIPFSGGPSVPGQGPGCREPAVRREWITEPPSHIRMLSALLAIAGLSACGDDESRSTQTADSQPEVTTPNHHA